MKRRWFNPVPIGLPFLGLAMAVVSMGWTATAHTDEFPCVRMGRALAHGSVSQRTEAAEAWRGNVTAAVEQCRPDLEKAFQADARKFVNREPPELWRDENRLLVQLLQVLDVQAAGQWAPRLDPTVLRGRELGTVTQYWMSSAEPAIDEAFSLLKQIDDTAIQGAVLHALLPRIIELESTGVTSATEVARGLQQVGARRLVEDRVTAMLWPLSVPPRPFEAKAALLAGDLDNAFRLYAEAAKTEKTYLFHTAVLAERLFQTGDLDPTELIPLQINYSLCKRTYRVEQGLGAIYKLRQSPDNRELAAELALWQDTRCRDTRDDVEKARVLARALQEHYPGTRAAARQRLIRAEAIAARADQLADSGRSNRAHELRREALELLEDPAFFVFPGGPTKARALAHYLLSELPPDLGEPGTDADERGDEADDTRD